MKVQKSSHNINPFGGINFITREITNIGLPQLIDKELGARPHQSTYKYSDVLLNYWSIIFCGGDCAEDITEHLKDYLKSTPGLNVASADTLLRTLKVDNNKVTSTKGKEYETNRHDVLNRLNMSILKLTGLLEAGKSYDFDFDNEVLRTEKFDTKKTYKKVNGYFPGMATLAGFPVYFENRDGNMNVKTDQDELLKRCFAMLDGAGFKVKRARMDAGSYTQKVVEVVEANSEQFYIRANRCEELTQQLLEGKAWRRVEINSINYEVCSVEYLPFAHGKEPGDKTYRLVVAREDVGEKQVDMFTGDTLKYRSILTNDRVSSEEGVIEYYNQRGLEERTIDALNNDFAWNRMPFSFMGENTVFLMVMMICKNIFTWLLRKFSGVFEGLTETSRLKKFIFRFVTVPAKWIKHGRQEVLKVYSTKPYERLYCR
jgi:hypothetical protein